MLSSLRLPVVFAVVANDMIICSGGLSSCLLLFLCYVLQGRKMGFWVFSFLRMIINLYEQVKKLHILLSFGACIVGATYGMPNNLLSYRLLEQWIFWDTQLGYYPIYFHGKIMKQSSKHAGNDLPPTYFYGMIYSFLWRCLIFSLASRDTWHPHQRIQRGSIFQITHLWMHISL